MINELSDLRLIDSIGVNERTIVSWYDKKFNMFNFGIFHLTERPNYISKLSGLTEYGYLTYVGTPIRDPEEAGTLYMLFLSDLMQENNWWEDDGNIFISDEDKKVLEERFVDKINKIEKTKFQVLDGGKS